MKAEISKAVHNLFSTNQYEAVVSHSTPNIQVVNYATGQVFNGQDGYFYPNLKKSFLKSIYIKFKFKNHVK